MIRAKNARRIGGNTPVKLVDELLGSPASRRCLARATISRVEPGVTDPPLSIDEFDLFRQPFPFVPFFFHLFLLLIPLEITRDGTELIFTSVGTHERFSFRVSCGIYYSAAR